MSWSDGDSGDVVEFDEVGCAGVLGVVGGCVGLSVGTTAVKVQYIIIMCILLLCTHNNVCILLLCIIHVQYL